MRATFGPPLRWPTMDVIGAVVVASAVVAISWLLLVAFLWLHRPSRDLAVAALRLSLIWFDSSEGCSPIPERP